MRHEGATLRGQQFLEFLRPHKYRSPMQAARRSISLILSPEQLGQYGPWAYTRHESLYCPNRRVNVIDYYGGFPQPVSNLLLARRLVLQVREAFRFSPPPSHRIEHETCDDRQKSQDHEPGRKHCCWKARN